MSNKPLIFHIAKWYPNRHDSMLGLFVKRHILSTLPYTDAAVFYAMACPNMKCWYEMEYVLDDGIHTYRGYYKKHITGINALDKIIKLALYFYVVIKLYKQAKRTLPIPKLFHVHVLLRTAIVAFVLSRLEGVSYVVLEHATRFIRDEKSIFNNKFERALTKYFLSKSKGVIAVSISLANAIKSSCSLHKTKFYVIYNCVDISVFKPGSKGLSEKKEFVYVAEFIDGHKNISGLLHVVAKLYKQRKDFVLCIVGYGKDEQVLKELAFQLKILNSAVVFEGKKTGVELVKIITQAEALLLFSNYENLPCVITEAFCCGIPVVSTAVGGIAEIVNPQNGVLIAKSDHEAMIHAMNQILNKELVFDRNEIEKQAIDLFSNESVGRQLNEVYKEAMIC